MPIIRGVGVRAMVRLAACLGQGHVTVVVAHSLPMTLGPIRRRLLARASVIIASAESAQVLRDHGLGSRLLVPATALAATPAWSAPERIVHIGPLTPASGVVDVLACAAAWAAANTHRRLELIWHGDGDMRGVLRAQPTPPTLVQHFAPEPGPGELVSALDGASFLLVADLDARASGAGFPLVAAAMTAGVPVLGSQRNHAVHALVVHGHSGWLFDPLHPPSLSDAFHLALSAPPDARSAMRVAARARGTELLADAIGATDTPMPQPRRYLVLPARA